MNELRFLLRRIARSPGFNALVVLTLALGLGASSLIFSVIDGVLLEPLPFPDARRIVRVFQLDERDRRANPSDPNFADLKEQSRSFSALAQFGSYDLPVAGGNEAARPVVADVSHEFFAVLGVQPLSGRAFAADEQQVGGAPVALISYDFWQRYLSGTPEFGSRRLKVGDGMFSVVGVLPRGFDYPDGTDIWLPLERWPIGKRTAHNWQAIGRLAPHVSLAAASDDLTAVARRVKATYGDDTLMAGARIVPMQDELVGRVRPALLVLAAAAALLLIVACANVVNMLLARGVAREQEIAVRLALGAERTRLARDVFAEALVLCCAGGALGLLLTWLGIRVLATLEAGLLPRADRIAVDWLTVAVTLSLAVLAAAAVSGLVASRTPSDGEALRANPRAIAGGSRSWLRDGLVAAQIGVALVLTVGAVLLGRSFASVTNVDPGFRPDGAVLMNVALAFPVDAAGEARLQRFHEQVLERLETLPGIEAVGAVNAPPLTGGAADGTFVTQTHRDEIRDMAALSELLKDRARTGNAEYRIASEGYFAAMGIPLLRGRWFAAGDGLDSEHVALVSRSLAESTWPGQEPLGKLVQFGGMDGDLTPFTIVGVVGDVRDYGLERDARPTFYSFYRQRPRQTTFFWFAIRGPDPKRYIPAAREIVRGIDPDVLPKFQASADLYSRSIAQRRFTLTMLAAFCGTALLLALVGIYGAISFAVAQRTNEIGVRLALGATVPGVVAMMLRHSVWLATAGIAGGVVVALGASQLIGSLLYGVAPNDLASYTIAAAVLLVVSTAAASIPSLRAARVDPMTTLRRE